MLARIVETTPVKNRSFNVMCEQHNNVIGTIKNYEKGYGLVITGNPNCNSAYVSFGIKSMTLITEKIKELNATSR